MGDIMIRVAAVIVLCVLPTIAVVLFVRLWMDVLDDRRRDA